MDYVNRIRLVILCLLCGTANAQTSYEKTQLISANTSLFPAKGYGNCTWSSAGDVGPCINLAIAAAAAAGGGTVIIPASAAGSYFGLATQILQTTPGVKLQGAGLGAPRDTFVSSRYLGVTMLKWTGGSTANPMILVQTPDASHSTLYGADVTGIVADCNAATAGVGIKINGVSFSTFKVAAAECSSINILFAVPTYLEGYGNQYNDIWAYSRSTSTAACGSGGCPTGIMFDSAAGATLNTSYNRIHDLYAWYNKGDGIVFGDSDNNTVTMIETATQTPGTSTGQPIVCANNSYTSPNSVAVSDGCRSLRVLHYGGRGFVVQGSQSSSALTVGTHAGTAALNNGSFTVSTNAAQGAFTLLTNSTSGLNANESISCGGPANGFISNNPINQIVANTSVTFAGSFVYTVPASTVCTATYGFTSQAPIGAGTYTITATSATDYSIAYSGTGTAHTQTGVQASGGFLTFTDIVLPWTGTPTTNDTWTVTLPRSTRYVDISGIDTGNNSPTPTFEYGASGTWWPQGQALPWAWNEPCVYFNMGGAATTNAQIGNLSTGRGACAFGGVANIVSGNFSSSFGGGNNAVTANGAASFGGQNNSLTGIYSAAVGGFYISDRGRYGSTCYASGRLAAVGDAQECSTVLRGTGSTGSAFRLTSDGLTAGSDDCVNLPANSAYALSIEIVAFDHTTVTKFASWNDISGLLTKGANAASTALAVVSATPAVSHSGGTLTGNSMSLTADTTNGCLNISWTPPTSNTDTWNVVARVRTVETQ